MKKYDKLFKEKGRNVEVEKSPTGYRIIKGDYVWNVKDHELKGIVKEACAASAVSKSLLSS